MTRVAHLCWFFLVLCIGLNSCTEKSFETYILSREDRGFSYIDRVDVDLLIKDTSEKAMRKEPGIAQALGPTLREAGIKSAANVMYFTEPNNGGELYYVDTRIY